MAFYQNKTKTNNSNLQLSTNKTVFKETLNYIDNKKENEIAQAAILRGIEGVKPPLRLALYPYISSYAENPADQSGINYSFNYGADLKYGINESFTLDLTLIPDFGQVESDLRQRSAYDEMVGRPRQVSADNTMEISLGSQPLPEWLN